MRCNGAVAFLSGSALACGMTIGAMQNGLGGALIGAVLALILIGVVAVPKPSDPALGPHN